MSMRMMGLALAVLLACPGAGAPPTGTIEGARFVDTIDLGGQVFHVQGVDLDRRHIWVTSVDLEHRRGYLDEFDRRTGAMLRQMELTDGNRFHPGGISIDGDAIWVPVAEMKPNSSAVLVRIDRRSLEVRQRIAVADHIGCIAVSGRELIAGNWDSRLFYVFDRQGRAVRTVPNPFATRYQDMKFARGRLIASGLLTSLDGTIDWIAWPSLERRASLRSGPTDRAKAVTSEGMAVNGRDLYFVPEDGPSRLLHFRLNGPR